MAPQMQQTSDSDGGIWTQDVSQSFYGNVNALSRRLKETESPRIPINYRILASRDTETKPYLLSYEEELHLADHFAFLAHVSEGVECVSAATIEQTDNPPALTIRLASNHTPGSVVIDGINKILDIVRNHAEAGKHREHYKSRLFEEIISLSQKRIYGRMRTHQWQKPSHLRRSGFTPLYVKIDKKLEAVWPPGERSAEFASLRASLITLRDALKKVDKESNGDQLSLLKDAILKCHHLSNRGASKSLESHMQRLGLPERIFASREVAEIDKLSNYWTICNDLIRLSRQPETRSHCLNLKLEVCLAFPPSQPLGAADLCYVHGEIQLIFFYEKYSHDLPPRAIGSSKSACFLCDLFIKYHGKLGISHSHMKLYPKWTIPASKWMKPQQRKFFRTIVRSMGAEMNELSKKSFYHHNISVESRAHVILLEQSSSIASSDVTTIVDIPHTRSPLEALEVRMSNASTSTIVPDENTMDCSNYRLEDLPIALKIWPSTLFCELTAGYNTYLFDCEEMDVGLLHVSNVPSSIVEPETKCINVMELSLDSSICLQAEPDTHCLKFVVHFDEQHKLGICVTWQKP